MAQKRSVGKSSTKAAKKRQSTSKQGLQPATVVSASTGLLVDAYSVGLRLNRLLFHLQHAWVFSNRSYLDQVRLIGAELGVLIRRLIQFPENRRETQIAVTTRIQYFVECCESEAHADEYCSANQELADDPHADIGNWQRSFFAWLFKWFAEFREMIISAVDVEPIEKCILAIELGEEIDQGECPASVFLAFVTGTCKTLPDRLQGSTYARGWGSRSATSSLQLVTNERVPGEIRPDTHWYQKISNCCQELKLDVNSDILALCQLAENNNTSWIRGLGDLSHAIMLQLGRQVRNPALSPIVSSNDDRDKWIYERLMKGVPYQTVIADLRRIAFENKWRRLSTSNSIKRAANSYALRNNLSPVPSRQRRTNNG